MKRFTFILLLMVSGLAAVGAELPDGQDATPAVRYEVATEAGSGRGKLTVWNAADASVTFRVYSITGQLMATLSVRHGSESVELPKGFYIVKSEAGSQKIVVR